MTLQIMTPYLVPVKTHKKTKKTWSAPGKMTILNGELFVKQESLVKQDHDFLFAPDFFHGENTVSSPRRRWSFLQVDQPKAQASACGERVTSGDIWLVYG